MLLEIGSDVIDTASSFVNYMSEAYGFSKSSVWYVLNRLKEKGVVDFASKDEIGKGMALTKAGLDRLRTIEPLRNNIMDRFSERSIIREEYRPIQQYAQSYAIESMDLYIKI
jgi:DNA-binding PadR family transcriptional regulator